MSDQASEQHWECELQGTDADLAGVRFVTLGGLDGLDLDAQAVSGITTLMAGDAVISDGKIKIPQGAKKILGKAEKRGPAAKKKKSEESKRRVLASLDTTTVDDKIVLALRVTAPDATMTADAAH